MTKRAHKKFSPRPRDTYLTPQKPVLPLRFAFSEGETFYEPCAADNGLTNHLINIGLKCVGSSDIEPLHPDVKKQDALTLTEEDIGGDKCTTIITNPPWTRELLHPMIEHFRMMKPTWLLFDANWMNQEQAAPYLRYCHIILSVGRVSWMGNGVSGFDDACWYLFEKEPNEFATPLFINKYMLGSSRVKS